ncbi:unnamed protein product [Cutaneotrichosporon oleaginosum]
MKRARESEDELSPTPPPKPKRQPKKSRPRVHSSSPSPLLTSASDTKPDLADKPKKKGKTAGGPAAGRKWTAAEYLALLNHAMPKVPQKAWEGVLPDRTALQCDRAWK